MLDFLERHQRVALLFSGGADSIACLMLARPHWERIDVVWVNPGNPYPETIEQMATVAAMVPHFVRVQGRQPSFIAEHGHPLDVVPISMTPFGRLTRGTAGPKVSAVTHCCGENLWKPAHQFLQAGGYTGVIRGDRGDDALRPPVRSGDVVQGIEHHFPLERWSRADVLRFAGEWLPPSYRRGLPTSLDCINCTAHLEPARIEDLRNTAPAVHAEVSAVLAEVAGELATYTRLLPAAPTGD